MLRVYILKAFLRLGLANYLQEIKLNPAYLAEAGALGPLVGAGLGVGGLAGRRAGLRGCAGVGKGGGLGGLAWGGSRRGWGGLGGGAARRCVNYGCGRGEPLAWGRGDGKAHCYGRWRPSYWR